jgi:DNA polymerase IV
LPVRAILHVDMDAFYASVEQRDDPSLRGKPVLVGHDSRRGVVTTASYEARPSGARSAMPMMEALRLCPDAIVVPVRMARYVEVSEQIFAIFHRYTPLVQGLSLDEAFLDVTASQSLFGDGVAIARAIKNDIKRELHLTASAGVAPCRFVAKIASDLRKPDGLVAVREENVRRFLAPLPIEKMWGVGPKTAPKLRALGYLTLADLARASVDALERTLGSWGAHVAALARGEDDRDVDPNRAAKSVGAEQTYEHDLSGHDEIARTLLVHSERVAQRLVREGISARVVAIKLKYADFTLVSRRETLPEAVADTQSIYAAALHLLSRVDVSRAHFRLTGVSCEGLVDGPPTLTLFPDRDAEKRRTLEKLAADVADKFGGAGITRATLIGAKDEPRLGETKSRRPRRP